jgi:hypothetical protein
MVSSTSLPPCTVEKYRGENGRFCREKLNSIKTFTTPRQPIFHQDIHIRSQLKKLLIMLPLNGQNTAALQILNVSVQTILQKLTRKYVFFKQADKKLYGLVN